MGYPAIEHFRGGVYLSLHTNICIYVYISILFYTFNKYIIYIFKCLTYIIFCYILLYYILFYHIIIFYYFIVYYIIFYYLNVMSFDVLPLRIRFTSPAISQSLQSETPPSHKQKTTLRIQQCPKGKRIRPGLRSTIPVDDFLKSFSCLPE